MKKFVVISHTHWDREWYMPFEQFRLKLIDLIDNLLDILAKDENYIFHLDAQTIVLEDYLEIKSQNRALLEKYITKGNILVGPWYLQNDFYYTSGEATVRNLITGRKIAESFGKCSEVGYAPDQFGNVSQLPQILNGFGIDSFIFGRGNQVLKKDENGALVPEPTPAEFIWRGEDGSECIAVCLKYWYNNAQHIPEESKLANLLLDINEKNFEGFNVTPYILLMNGVDHLEPQEDVNEILALLRREGRDIRQYSLDEYVSCIKEYIKENGIKPSVYTGALNKGCDEAVLKGCRSSRVYLKIANTRAQDLLESEIEPLYAYLAESGLDGVNPSSEINYLWKQLMKNHPHDSICGCSRDEVHAHMEDNFKKINEMGGEVLKRGLKILTSHVNREGRNQSDWFTVAFNPHAVETEDVITAELYVPTDMPIESFAVTNENGEAVPYELLSEEKAVLDVFSGLNLPGVIDCTLYRFSFLSGKIPAFSHKEYVIKTNAKPVFAKKEFDGFENSFIKVETDGKDLIFTDKKSGKAYKNPFYIIDEADRGDSYVFRPSAKEKPLKILQSAANLTKNGVFEKEITLSYSYACPKDYDFTADMRNKETKEMIGEVKIKLASDGKVEINYSVNNVCKDHKIRFGFDFGVNADGLVTDSAFDFGKSDGTECFEYTLDRSVCNSTFAYASDNKNAFTVYTEGQHEAELAPGGMVITLARCTGYINKTPDCVPTGGAQWIVPGNQCLREMSGRLGLELGVQTPASCFAEAKVFRTGLLTATDSFDKKTYSRGRFAVQSAELEKYYFSKDKFEGKVVTPSAKFRFEGEDVINTSYRIAESGFAEARFVNFKSSDGTLKIAYDGAFELVRLDGKETLQSFEKEAYVALKPKQIITIRFK